jgi:MATE family multidrug resistance protein
MSMGLVDTLVAGQIGTTTLAGLGLASNFYWTFTSVCMGCLLALDTYFSQSLGARDHVGLARYLGQSWWSCAIVTLLAAVGVAVGAGLYWGFASASEVKDAFMTYIGVITWCLPSIFVFFVLQRYWQARHYVLAFSAIIIGANILNLAACLALGLGWWGFPALGVKGLAFATVTARYVMMAAALVYTWWLLRPERLRMPRMDWGIQRRIFGLGLPAAGHTALEVCAFTIATFLAGALGAVPLAAHNVCLIMAAFTFMFPLGFSAAAAVRVGTYIGAGEPERARLAGWLCIGISVTVMSAFALGYLAFPRVLLGWFTNDPAVVEVGAKILILVALFQIADGTQVSTTGALRGLGNTRAAMIANLIGHYPVGLALGLVLCFPLGLGAVGLWAGLAAGLISVAVILMRTWVVMSRDSSKLRPVLANRVEPVECAAHEPGQRECNAELR